MVVYGTLDVTLSGVFTQTKNKPRLSICHPKLVNMRGLMRIYCKLVKT